MKSNIHVILYVVTGDLAGIGLHSGGPDQPDCAGNGRDQDDRDEHLDESEAIYFMHSRHMSPRWYLFRCLLQTNIR